MNREESIKQVAENYASQMCKNCAAMLYCEEKNKKCVERREQENVYVDGAGEAEYAKRVQDSCGALMEMATEFGIIGGRDNESFNNIEEMVTERADPFVRELMNEITFAAGNENIRIKKLIEKYGKAK